MDTVCFVAPTCLPPHTIQGRVHQHYIAVYSCTNFNQNLYNSAQSVPQHMCIYCNLSHGCVFFKRIFCRLPEDDKIIASKHVAAIKQTVRINCRVVYLLVLLELLTGGQLDLCKQLAWYVT